MTHLSILIIAFFGFGLVALSMGRHQEDVFKQELPRIASRALRRGGWLLLVVALAVAVRGYGWAVGLVAYSGHTSAAAALVFLLLILRGRYGET